MDNEKWKEKFNDFITTCQGELKKTTAIGKKMLSASRINTELHGAFEALGKYAREQICQEKLHWKDERVEQLLEKIESCERSLEECEGHVQDIKSEKGPGNPPPEQGQEKSQENS